MAEFSVREYRPEDIPALKTLWLDCFGDKEEYIDAFLRLLPRTGTAVTAHCGGSLCGCAFLPDDMYLPAGGKMLRCALIYAVAVDKSRRKLGIGAALVKEAVELAGRRGAEIITVLPAEDSLYDWYKRTGGFECRLYRRSLSVESADMAMVDVITAEEYARRRGELLPDGNSIVYGAACLELQGELCRIHGGGLYSCAGAIAAAYKDGNTGIIQELLYPKGMDAELFAAAVGFEMGAEEVKLLLPGEKGRDERYLAALGTALPEDCRWPLAFD